MTCKCIATLNSRLRKQYGLKLADKQFCLSWPECETRLVIATQSVDNKKRKLAPVFAIYCPFCGKLAAKPKALPLFNDRAETGVVKL